MKNLLLKIVTAVAAALLAAGIANAQFYSVGEDPGQTRWSQIRTENYRLVYPEGLDSLAQSYAAYLEQVRIPVGGSLGYLPNQSYSKPLPVILHPFTSSSNGVVVWAPRRMELYTTPDCTDPESTPWPIQLAVHESRHVAQMQPYAGGTFTGKVILGELVPSVMAAIFAGPSGMEGDAVVAETALTSAGRGRTADFLEYQRACFAEGDLRDYWQWRYGSQKRYTPDYYKIGYMTAAGLRDIYGFDKWPYNALSKALPRSFDAIARDFSARWDEEAAERAPFMDAQRVSSEERLFLEYSSLEAAPDGIYALRSGLDEVQSIVKFLPDGGAEKIKTASYSSSRLKYNPLDGRLYWSETVKDPRWAMRSWSIIRSLDPKSGKTADLTSRTRYFNPSVSPDGRKLAANFYSWDGSAAVVVLDSSDGSEQESFSAPDGVQPVETAWIGDEIYVSVIAPGGMTVCRAGDFEPLFGAQIAKIKELDSHDGSLVFVSDRGGVDELYSFNPSEGKMYRLTNSRQGSNSHVFAGDTLYYTRLSSADRGVWSTALDDLEAVEVDPAQTVKYPLADRLSSEEPFKPDYDKEVEISQPEHYSKIAHSFKFHSWAPAYVNPDLVESLSLSSVYQYCGLGATAFFQNELSTLSGTVAYSAWTPSGGFMNAGHAKLQYTGLYPAIELSADIYDTPATTAYIRYDEAEQLFKSDLITENYPYFDAAAKVYLPLSVSKGGWTRGFIPQAKFSFSSSAAMYEGNGAYSSTLSLSARAYLLQSVPSSCLYPRWGIGAEAGYATSPGLTHLYVSNLYGYLYGYLPGLARTHGIRLTALAETLCGNAPLVSPYANVAPRGCTNLRTELARYKSHGKFTFDYTLPFGAVDWTWLCPLAYIRNFEFTAHYDLAWYKSSKESGNVSSAGADLVVKMGNLLWLPYTTRFGLSYNYNFGTLDVKRHYLGLIFSVDI